MSGQNADTGAGPVVRESVAQEPVAQELEGTEELLVEEISIDGMCGVY